MDIAEHLKEREIPDPVVKFTAELLEVFDGKRAHPLLTKRSAEIGLLILNKHRAANEDEHPWSIIVPATANSERFAKLKNLIPAEGFRGAELENLLIYFFGAEKAPLVARAWDKIRFEMYQTGYTRRSFRAPENRDLYFVNQLNFLIGALPQSFSWEYHSTGYQRRFFELSVAEQIRYSQFFPQTSLFRLWSAALDEGDEEVFRLMEDVIYNRDEFGKPTRDIIKSLLNSEKKEAWELVEKLLLAAQRQEGLRQTILEALDETGTDALKHMIDVILSNKLARFSSVVRALDVWAGFGWESEREKTVNAFLEKAREYLENPEKIPGAMKSASNLDVYMALWAQGVFDVEKCAPYLDALLEKGTAEKRALALKFALETRNERLAMPLFDKALDDHDLMVLAWALQGINATVSGKADEYLENPRFPQLFEKLHKIVERGAAREKSFEGRIFAWTRIVFTKDDALSAMIDLIGEDASRRALVLSYFEQLSVNLRTKLTQRILGDFASYRRDNNKEKPPAPTAFQRDFAFRLLSDRGEFMARAGFRTLQNAVFADAEIERLESLLKRRGADFRGKVIALLLNQPDEKLYAATARLLANGDGEQRLAGLDILLQAKKANRLRDEAGKLVEAFKARKSVSPKEEILLAQLAGAEESGTDFSAANGYGLFDPKKAVSPLVAPRVDPENVYEKRLARHEYGFSVPLDKVKKELARLGEIYLANKDHEYEAEDWSGGRQTILLGNAFRNRKYNHKFASGREEFENYPLPEVWEKWFVESGLDAGDLTIIGLSPQPRARLALPYSDELLPAEFNKYTYYGNPLLGIVEALRLAFPFAEKDEFMLGGTARLFAALDEATLKKEPKENQYYGHGGDGWQGDNRYHVFFYQLDAAAIDDKFMEELWNLAHWRQFSGRKENIPHAFPSLIVFCRAFERGIIGEDELLRGILTPENLRTLSGKIVRERDFDYFARFPFLKSLFEKAREHVLDVELRRGDTATSVTHFAAGLQAIGGARRFTEILAGLGKTPLNQGYSYYYGGEQINKQRSFSRLLKNCFPLESDRQDEFDALVRRAKIGEKKLIEAAVYAPQWQRFVSRHLNWKGLDSAIWWMHAHTKIAGYREQTAEAESEIARYSAVDLQDFKDGAVDREWFLAALREIGKTRWEIVYEAAKYISEGNGHRRARLYADVIAGKTKIREIAARVREKRDQDYLRVYGLAPLSRANPEKDVLSRYEYLQKFKRESRQFGAQKQASENLAVRIALENLARNAGYADPARLSWAMETWQVRAILSSETEVKTGDTTVKLVIDEEGKAELVAVKGDKTLKSIPPKLKKERAVAELQEHRKTLREQFGRARAGLEEAMIRGDEFTSAELETLFAHPVISKLLERLVFAANENLGFYRAGKLVSPNGNETALGGEDKTRIAHCVDLYNCGEWSDYQRHCFDRELKQPFKQIFREFYAPTDDEVKEKSVSRRYAGHQVQPKQAVALLKTRGWKVDYEEGLQKVFHKEGFTAKMYALADWFSPADVESPTLETIEFRRLKDYKRVDFEAIDARIFSEVMRDVDLVVSVAHAGGVDPEASHSTIEMRSVLLGETVRLFKLDNVEIGGNHARIKGKLGEYSIHLGSAVVHLMPGKYLSVLPVQSQHRGRIFLPFADDDPKSAEVVSKVLMFARDSEIQDPTILRQFD
ncbi:MAG TPA: DUF4132 domain-containing protein [Pyrinomonadaceae bacterium]|jgi:hypothetical protein